MRRGRKGIGIEWKKGKKIVLSEEGVICCHAELMLDKMVCNLYAALFMQSNKVGVSNYTF